jgi:hypothetical protein
MFSPAARGCTGAASALRVPCASHQGEDSGASRPRVRRSSVEYLETVVGEKPGSAGSYGRSSAVGAISPALRPSPVDEQPVANTMAKPKITPSNVGRLISLKNRPEQRSIAKLWNKSHDIVT